MATPQLPGSLAIDARMLRHSGIGVVLRSLLAEWLARPIAHSLVLLGDAELLRDYRGRAEIIPWRPGVYSPTAALAKPMLPSGTVAWYSPHYATCVRPGVPLVSHVQDVLHITHPTKRGTALYMQAYLTALRRNASFVLTSSRHVKVQLQTLHGFSAERVLITGLGSGIGPGETEALPDGFGAEPYLLAVGIFKPHKNWAFLFRELASRGEEVPPLAIAGLGKASRGALDLAASLGYRRLTLLPRLSDPQMRTLYRQAQALVFPSVAEGFGLPIVEALYHRTPVVHADRSPMKEIAGGAGWGFDPDWPPSFHDALDRVLRRGEDVEARLLDGERVASRCSWSRTAAITHEALWRATGGGP
jgi:glycosyltransferase involved in cell wall biosynthesis